MRKREKKTYDKTGAEEVTRYVLFLGIVVVVLLTYVWGVLDFLYLLRFS